MELILLSPKASFKLCINGEDLDFICLAKSRIASLFDAAKVKTLALLRHFRFHDETLYCYTLG